ncbi:MAG: iron ABC transporter permease, partial [Clostridia bacterium]|nr:iron ABC transporter permease [Clostridia bacterium]
MMGSFSGMKLDALLPVLLPMAAGLAILFFLRWRLNLLTMGDDEARAMGVNVNRLRVYVVLAATLLTAASVSVSGMIGWVGLVIPHLTRRMVGNDYRNLLPASMLFGAVFLLAADNFSRNLMSTEIPIGILTAFVGTPLFLWLLAGREAF